MLFRSGSGVTSDVFRVTSARSPELQYAMKKIPLKGSRTLQKFVAQEISIMKRLRHRHIVALVDHFEGPKTVWAVIELVSGGDLSHYVLDNHGWSEAEAGRCLHQVASGLAYLHSQFVAHRDVKLPNLLRADSTSSFVVKIADLGASAEVRSLPYVDSSASELLPTFKAYA
mgnify:CR=1 FL=1